MEIEFDCDVLIIGGGINGCGIAAEAASRGLTVILCEKNDLASATSSASSKLIHGGLRYLEQYNFSLVKKALKEREILFKLCPYLIKPLKFILPHQPHLRPFWLIKLGLFIYDFLCKVSVPKSKSLFRTINVNDFIPLKKSIKRGISYYDAQTLDARLVIINALQAQKYRAKIFTNSPFITTQRKEKHWISTLNINSSLKKVRSKVVVNATGPWVDVVNEQLKIKTPYHLSLVQGSHIVVDKLYEKNQAYILQNTDGRIIFTIPYEKNFTLIGTTDHLLETVPKQCEITEEEITYLLTVVNNNFNKQLVKKDIRHTYSGIRPLIKNKKSILSKNISRDYKIYNDNKKAFYTCIFGGKLTIYRLLSKETVDSWQLIFPKMEQSKSEKLLLPGANFNSLNELIQNLNNNYSELPSELINHYAEHYGSRTFELLKGSHSLTSLGLCFSKYLYQIEVDFLINNEWAKRSEDIIWRRTKHGLSMNSDEIKYLDNYIKSIN